MRGQGAVAAGWPRPGKTIIALLVVNVVVYVLELVLLRAGANWIFDLALTPERVFSSGYLWQPFTYMWLHSPEEPFHLFMNLLFLWMFGTPLEDWWGRKRLLVAYVVCGVSGAILTLLVAFGARSGLFGDFLQGFELKAHLGASGATLGLTIAWGIVFWDQTMNFLFFGQMRVRTFIWIIVGFQVIAALSFSPTSSTAHFGGMIGSWILCKGLWKPRRLLEFLKRTTLKMKKRRVESKLRIIEGQGGQDLPKKKDPPTWN